MLAWLSKNIATIIICLVLAVIVALIIFSLVKNKKKRQILLRLQLCPLCYGRLLPQRESAKGQKAQLISTTEQKKGRSANCVLLAYSGGFFPRFADIIKETAHIGGAKLDISIRRIQNRC